MWKRRLYSEPLERRELLAVGIASFDSAAGIVRFTGDLGGSIDDSLVLGEAGGLLTHNATVGIFDDNRDIDPGIGIAHLNLATATLIQADLGAGDDSANASALSVGVKFYGGDGADTLRGGSGDDTLEGGTDSDVIFSGGGTDIIDGGSGSDFFTFEAASGVYAIDALSRNLVITSSGDGSTTGPNGAVDVETVFVNATGIAASTFNVGDLSRTSVSTLAIRPAAAGVAGSSALISGSALDDEIALGDSTVLGAIDPTVTFANYDIVLPDGIGTLSVNGRAGNDRIRVNAISASAAAIVLAGGEGDDLLDASRSTRPTTLNGGDDDDTLIASPGTDTLDGGTGFDRVLIQGTANNDVIRVAQSAPSDVAGDLYQLVRTFNGVTTTLSIAKTAPALAPSDETNRPTVEEVRIEGQNGNDTIRVVQADAYFDPAGPDALAAQLLRFSVDGGAPNASDRLIVDDDGIGDLVLVRQGAVAGSGRVTVAPVVNNLLGEIIYENIERVDVLPIDPVSGGTGPADPTLQGRVVVFQADPFEYNDNRLSPTEITDLATTHLNPSIESFAQLDPEIPTPNDEDWYVIEPTKTTTFRLDVRFETISSVPSGRPGLPGNGDLDIAVYDSAGTLIAAGTTVPGSGDQVAFGAQAGQRYYLRVKGAPLATVGAEAINTYTIGVTQLDDAGPQVTSVTVTGSPLFNLFGGKGSGAGPTPLVNSLTIGIQDLPPRAPGFSYPALVGGPMTEVEANNSLLTAQNIDQAFNLTSDPNIGDQTQNTSKTIPHATITGSGDGTFDYYSFTVTAPGTKAIFDIDNANNLGVAIDTELFLYDLGGTLLADNDNADMTFGGGGSTNGNDPYLEFTFTTAGTYVIGVAKFNSTGNPGGIAGVPLAAGDVYTLNASVVGHQVLLSPASFEVRGDAHGIAAISQVKFVPDPIVPGQPATGHLEIEFAQPLADDRWTLTIFDTLTDPGGNKLDGESNASQPNGAPNFPSGNGVAGGNFVARFTVDSRPEIAVYSGYTVVADINGNGYFDPANGDATNRDLSFQFVGLGNQRFAGRLVPPGGVPGFDVLASYDRDGDGVFRFRIDYNMNGRHDDGPVETRVSPAQVNGLAVAGNFDGNAANGDEIAIFNGSIWYILSNDLNSVAATVNPGLVGYPIAGDFDGDGLTDLGTYRSGAFSISLATAVNNFSNTLLQIPFAAQGVLNRPVAADMDQDGITDLGLWIPYSGVGQGTGEFRFLISNDPPTALPPKRILGTVNTLAHGFSPTPLGADVAYRFGEPTALPLVGNFDPPVTQAGSTSSSGSSGGSSTAGAGTAPPPPSNTSFVQTQSFVAALYQDIFGRTADAPGLDRVTSSIQAGASRQATTASFLTQHEHLARRRRFLCHVPAPRGRSRRASLLD